MKVILLVIVALMFGGIEGRTIKESFIIKLAPDNATTLKFKRNGTYEYNNWNGWGGTKILSEGKYELKEGLISFQTTKQDSTYEDDIPDKLFFSKLSKEEFENIEEDIFSFKEEKFLFKKKYLVLSESKLIID